jgi:hypothetical protein
VGVVRLVIAVVVVIPETDFGTDLAFLDVLCSILLTILANDQALVVRKDTLPLELSSSFVAWLLHLVQVGGNLLSLAGA